MTCRSRMPCCAGEALPSAVNASANVVSPISMLIYAVTRSEESRRATVNDLVPRSPGAFSVWPIGRAKYLTCYPTGTGINS